MIRSKSCTAVVACAMKESIVVIFALVSPTSVKMQSSSGVSRYGKVKDALDTV